MNISQKLEYLGYNPQNSRRLSHRRVQVTMPQSHLGERRKQSQEGNGGRALVGERSRREKGEHDEVWVGGRAGENP